MPGTLEWQRYCLGDACQTGKMATLLNSSFFVFNISILPNYHVKCYDYFAVVQHVKWCVSVDIGLILALSRIYHAGLPLTISIEASHIMTCRLTGELCVVAGGDNNDPVLLNRNLVADARELGDDCEQNDDAFAQRRKEASVVECELVSVDEGEVDCDGTQHDGEVLDE